MPAPLKGPERAAQRFGMRVTPGLLRAVDELKRPGESRADVVRRALRELYRQQKAGDRATAGRAVVNAAMSRPPEGDQR